MSSRRGVGVGMARQQEIDRPIPRWVHARLISQMPILTADRSALSRALALRLALHKGNLPITGLAALADAAPQCAIIGVFKVPAASYRLAYGCAGVVQQLWVAAELMPRSLAVL